MSSTDEEEYGSSSSDHEDPFSVRSLRNIMDSTRTGAEILGPLLS